MEGAHRQGIAPGAHQSLQPALHRPGRLVGEGDGHDAVRADAADPHQVGDAMGDYPGFATTRPGDDEDGAVNGLDGLPLGGI